MLTASGILRKRARCLSRSLSHNFRSEGGKFQLGKIINETRWHYSPSRAQTREKVGKEGREGEKRKRMSNEH